MTMGELKDSASACEVFVFGASCFIILNLTCKENRCAVPFDIRYDDRGQNLLHERGFLHAVLQTCRLQAGSGALFAPVCAAWIFLHPTGIQVRLAVVGLTVF